MAEIISASLDELTVSQLKDLTEKYGFKGKSEAVRTAVRLLHEESKSISGLKGVVELAAIVIHPERTTSELFKVMHADQRFVKSHVHFHLDKDKCLDLLVLKGEAAIIESIAKKLKRTKSSTTKTVVL